MFRVHVGFTAAGRDKWRTFKTLEAASAFCARVFEATGVVLTVVRS